MELQMIDLTRVLYAVVVSGLFVAPAFAQECLHGTDETPEQKTRRQQALGAARAVNTMQFADRRACSSEEFLDHKGLAEAAAQKPNPRYDFKPGAEIVPGWQLTLDRTGAGYWFMIKDTTDTCGFAYVSNHGAVIYSAAPIR
jgi:hypothetical protein